jgi:hypothetical protein
LSLHAVLDTDALAAWLGDTLPATCPGLLHFFFADPDVPYETCRQLDIRQQGACRVIPADPARAVVTAAPAPAPAYPTVPVHAAGVVMLPDSWDVKDELVEFDLSAHWGASSLNLPESPEENRATWLGLPGYAPGTSWSGAVAAHLARDQEGAGSSPASMSHRC